MKAGDAQKEQILNAEEKSALKKLQREAKNKGATLANDGKGGLLPSAALGAFRAGAYRCKKCGGQKDLSLHHKAHLENPGKNAAKLDPKGMSPKDLAVLCADCHDDVHEKDRKEG